MIEMDPSDETQRRKVTAFPAGEGSVLAMASHTRDHIGLPTCVVSLELRAQPYKDHQAAKRDGENAMILLVIFL